MKVLLINPGVRDRRQLLGRYVRILTPVLPLGLAYIAAVLREAGHQVQVEDQYATGITHEQLITRIDEQQIELVGISTLTSLQTETEALVQRLKVRVPHVKVMLGNVHASALPELTLKETGADFVVHGEGESIVCDLVDALEHHRSLDEVKGITYRDGDTYTQTPSAPLIQDLDAIPFPAWDLFDLSLYPTPLFFKNRPMFPFNITRGCPFNCTFCSQNFVFPGNKVRSRSMKNVVDEMEWAMQTFGRTHFGITDAIFPYTEKQTTALADEIMNRGLHKKIIWFTEMHTKMVKSMSMLKTLKESGCYQILLGIESGDDAVLKISNKRQETEDIRRAVTMISKAGIRTFGLFVIGLPGETKETALKTIELARELPLTIAKFNRATPYPGSDLYHVWEAKRKEKTLAWNKLSPISWDRFSPWAPVEEAEDISFVPDGMTPLDLINMQNLAVQRFYLKPSRMLYLITRGIVNWRHLYEGGLAILGGFIDSLAHKKQMLVSAHPALNPSISRPD